LNGPASAPSNAPTAHEVVHSIYNLAVGESRIQPMPMGTLGDLGVGLQFDDAYPPSSSVLVTRLPNVIDEFGRSVRQWRMNTRGTHLAMGFASSKQGPMPTGTTYYLPFSMVITEVPYPFPVYP
jgi:hypothetical protein